MRDRERLIRYIKQSNQGYSFNLPERTADYLINKGALLPLCKLGGYVYRMEKYNGENKVYRYKVTGISYELHGDEASPLYSARCEELEGYATERLMFFESAVGKTVFLAEEDVEGVIQNDR